MHCLYTFVCQHMTDREADAHLSCKAPVLGLAEQVNKLNRIRRAAHSAFASSLLQKAATIAIKIHALTRITPVS